jgi:hypothetical protein
MKGRIIDKYHSKQYFLGKLNDFMNVHQGGSIIEAYQDKFLALSKYKTNISGEEIVSRFVQGVTKDIRYKVEVVSPSNLAKVVQKAFIYEANMKRRGFNMSSNDQVKGKAPLEKRSQYGTNWKNTNWKRDSNEGSFNLGPSKAEVDPVVFLVARKLDLCLQCLEKGHKASTGNSYIDTLM